MGKLSHKKIHLSYFALFSIFNIFFFQNCSNSQYISPNLLDSSSNESTSSDTPIIPTLPAPALTGQMKTVFMATGHMGRTVMSCDDGQTWINDRSENDNARCWSASTDPNYVECDHTPYSGRGLDASGGYFYTNHGWGFNGSVKKSRDGKNWETIQTGSWGGGIAAFGASSLFRYTEGGGWFKTANQGANWTELKEADLGFSRYLLDHPAVHRENDKIFVIGRTPGLAVSTNQGATWFFLPNFLPEHGTSGFAEGNGILLSAGQKNIQGQPTLGYVARSVDNGKTWTSLQLGGSIIKILFNGTHFVAWDYGNVFKSVDGVNWTSTPRIIDAASGGRWGGPIAYDQKTKTYVSILSNWGNFYEKQKFYRSIDGVNWVTLDATKAKGGHPISYIVSGEIDKAFCP